MRNIELNLNNHYRSLEKKISKYLAVTKTSFSSSSTYLINLFAKSFPTFIRIWIFMQLYETTFSVRGISSVNGLTVTMTIWILAFAQSFQSSTRPPVSRIVNDEVRSGDLQYVISRPYSYLGFHYFSQLGKIVAFLLPNIAVAVLASLFFVGLISFSIQGILWGILLLFLGLTLDFLMSFSLGILAFWVEDATSFTWIYHKAQIILGGLIIPISMFPDGVRKIVEWLPFSQIFYSSALTMVAFDMQVAKKFLLIQGFWIVLILGIITWAFNRGTRNISINGG